MSRNLCRTDCYFCRGEVTSIEAPRLPTESDLGRYFDMFRHLHFSHAACVDCEAKYLAWHDNARWGSAPIQLALTDLSFRSTFNDEPGDDDLPKWKIGRVRVGPWTGETS